MFKFAIDAEALADSIEKQLTSDLNTEISNKLEELGHLTLAHIRENVNSKIENDSEKNIFQNNLNGSLASADTFIITLDADALWIEDGYKGGDMREFLLKDGSGIKTSKEGYKFRSIPFLKNAKVSSGSTTFQESQKAHIKSYLRKNKIPYGIEKDASGNPIISNKPLHSFSLPSSSRGKGTTPTLQDVRIYQNLNDKGKVERKILTLRTISENPATSHKWHREGTKGAKLLDEAYDWLQNHWEQYLLPQILEKYK